MVNGHIDGRVQLLANIPREIYEGGRSIGRSLELMLAIDGVNLVANFFNYDWSRRINESEEPCLKSAFIIGETEEDTAKGVHDKILDTLIQEKYFVEESGQATILLAPLVTSLDYVGALVDNFVKNLKESKDPRMERPRLGKNEIAYRVWLENYHRENGMRLPDDFNRRAKEALRGMFYGITDPERIEQRLREKQFVVEFYKAHDAKLPNGFEKWGHKKVEVLYKKLMLWYGNGPSGTGQLPLFT